MLSAVDKVYVMTLREIRLLARNRPRLIRTLATPLAGGVVCGWMTITTALPPLYCLIVFMALGALVGGTDRGNGKVSETVCAISGKATFASAWALSSLLILLSQATVLVVSAALIGGFHVPRTVLAATVVGALAVSAVARRL